MGNRAEVFRMGIRNSDDPIRKHSLNQRHLKEMMQARERGFNRKAVGASERREREDRFLEDLPRMQFNRALEHIIDGTPSDEDIRYVLGNIFEYEQVVKKVRFRFGERRRRVTISVVDFTARNVQTEDKK